MPMDSFRLLSSGARISFRAFSSPDHVTEGYAILSHVCRNMEPSIDELKVLVDQGATYDDPRVDDKVRQCCMLTRRHEVSWFWIDSPCIDQRNSTELSEAISSMHAWYAQAAVCFAHLPDVPPDDNIYELASAFRRSVYFTRSWTLQELIAPKRVIFVASDWTVLGEKEDLAELLEEITGIDRHVLTFHRPLADVSIACRLSWAAGRNARRLEDKAYSLLGLLEIHMPMMYGEGEKAFTRLLQAILKEKCDHTVLAWGSIVNLPSPPLLSLQLPGSCQQQVTAEGYSGARSTPVFPASPAAFVDSAHLKPVDIEEFMSTVVSWGALSEVDSKHSPRLLPRFTFDQYGLECYLPVVCYGSAPTAALLACRDQVGSFIALALHPQSSRCLLHGIGAAGGTYNTTMHAAAPPRLFRVSVSSLKAAPWSTQGWAPLRRTARLYTIRFMTIHIATRPTPPGASLSIPYTLQDPWSPHKQGAQLPKSLPVHVSSEHQHRALPLRTSAGRSELDYVDRTHILRVPLWFRNVFIRWSSRIWRRRMDTHLPEGVDAAGEAYGGDIHIRHEPIRDP
ncbi:HET-domain-containing protein [Cubamyces sp. BRFM 1775]|nr:HET-domain-containing protein [Cubamyces sp. BRFM 1775]